MAEIQPAVLPVLAPVLALEYALPDLLAATVLAVGYNALGLGKQCMNELEGGVEVHLGKLVPEGVLVPVGQLVGLEVEWMVEQLDILHMDSVVPVDALDRDLQPVAAAAEQAELDMDFVPETEPVVGLDFAHSQHQISCPLNSNPSCLY
jgi:hypothetical protein